MKIPLNFKIIFASLVLVSLGYIPDAIKFARSAEPPMRRDGHLDGAPTLLLGSTQPLSVQQWMLLVETRLGHIHLERKLTEAQCTDILVKLMEVPSRDNLHQMATINRAWCLQ